MPAQSPASVLELIPRPSEIGPLIDRAETSAKLLRRLFDLAVDAQRQRERLANNERVAAARQGGAR